MMRGMSTRSFDIDWRRAFSSARSGDPGAYVFIASLTGGGTRRFPLKPASVRAATSGETLSAPGVSSSLEVLDELGAPEVARAGWTAEADILNSSRWRADQHRKIRRAASKPTPAGCACAQISFAGHNDPSPTPRGRVT